MLVVFLLRCWLLLLTSLTLVRLGMAEEPGATRVVRPLPPVNSRATFQAVAAPEMVPQPSRTSVPGRIVTLAELQELALARNPAIARASAHVEAAHGRWVQVGLRNNPVVGYEGTDIGEGGSAGKHGGFVSQEFITGNKRHIAREVVQREIFQLQQELEVIRRRVMGDVQAGYLEAAFAQRNLQLVSEMFGLAENEVRLMERLRKAQEVSTLEVLAVQRVRDRVKLRLQQDEYRLATAWRKLAAVVGVPSLTRANLENPVSTDAAQTNWDDVLERILSESPQMAAAVAALEQARWQLQLAYAQRRPNYEVAAGVQNDTLANETLANVAVGVPLPLFNRNQGAICEAQAKITAAENEIDRIRLNLQQRLANRFGAFLQARHRAEYFDQTILPNLQKSLELVERAFQQQQLDYLTVVRTQRELIQTRLDQLESQQQVQTTLADMENLLLSDSLD